MIHKFVSSYYLSRFVHFVVSVSRINESYEGVLSVQNRIRKMKPGSKEFHFVFMGDSRGKNDDCFLSGEFELVLKKAVKRNPLFIVHGGDAVFTGKQEKTESLLPTFGGYLGNRISRAFKLFPV